MLLFPGPPEFLTAARDATALRLRRISSLSLTKWWNRAFLARVASDHLAVDDAAAMKSRTQRLPGMDVLIEVHDEVQLARACLVRLLAS
jgi:hypothetical protein